MGRMEYDQPRYTIIVTGRLAHKFDDRRSPVMSIERCVPLMGTRS
jgi:hypothetical protein